MLEIAGLWAEMVKITTISEGHIERRNNLPKSSSSTQAMLNGRGAHAITRRRGGWGWYEKVTTYRQASSLNLRLKECSDVRVRLGSQEILVGIPVSNRSCFGHSILVVRNC